MKLLVHSCNSRSWLWKHWENYFYRSGWLIDYTIIDGDEAFSDQLKTALESIDDEYIFYMLDDFFIRRPLYFYKYLNMAIDMKMDALRLQPGVQHNSLPYRFGSNITQFYRFTETDGLLKQTDESAYLMSMQASIWRREYFLQCLTPGLDPWELEFKDLGDRFGDVYFVPNLPKWYIDAVLKGKLTKEGQKMIDEDNAMMKVTRSVVT